MVKKLLALKRKKGTKDFAIAKRKNEEEETGRDGSDEKRVEEN